MNAIDLQARRTKLRAAIAEHDRLARQAGRAWYDLAAVLAAYARVKTARHALHPQTLAAESGAAHELELYGDSVTVTKHPTILGHQPAAPITPGRLVAPGTAISHRRPDMPETQIGTAEGDPPDFTTERWEPVYGYEGLYEVSDHGRVRTLSSGKFRYRSHLIPQPKDGYRFVGLHRDGKSINRPIHQLVLEAFVGPRPPGLITRHLNDVRHDNRLENLTWGTYSENSLDCKVNGGRRRKHRLEGWNR